MKSDEQLWVEEAFLAARMDPEYPAVQEAYHTNVYVHALVQTLIKYMKRVQELESAPTRQFTVSRELWEEMQMSDWIWGIGDFADGTR